MEIINIFIQGLQLFFGIIWGWISGITGLIGQLTGISVPFLITMVIAIIAFAFLSKMFQN